MMLIDAHAHLWKQQKGRVDGAPVYSIGGGKSNFGGQVRQMMPPYMTDGENTAERLIANMDYAGVSGAVITQEEIDGNQDAYLLEAKRRYPNRLKICALYEEDRPLRAAGCDGIKICGGRLRQQDLTAHAAVFEQADRDGQFISIDLADGDRQKARFCWQEIKMCALKAAASPGCSTGNFTPTPPPFRRFYGRASSAAWKS